MIFSDLIDEKISDSADSGILGEVSYTGKYGLKIFDMNLEDEQLARRLGKENGIYKTVNIDKIIHTSHLAREYLINVLVDAIEFFIKEVDKKEPSILVVGLGNAFLLADSLGAKVVTNLLITHNLPKAIKRGLGDLSALIPGVSGLNGISTYNIVKSVVDTEKPDIIIVIDALTAKNYERLGCSFQFSNTSVSPGAGVGNVNRKLSKYNLGVDVIAVGVPLMINAKNFADLAELPNLVVTPKEIDIYVNTCAKVLAKALNIAIHGKKYKFFI